MPTFDLLAEPWIPVVREDGTRDEVGLRKALLDAPRIRAISDPMPTVEFGLYRLLVVLVMDIFELKEVWQLGDLLRAGQFDAARVDEHFAQWGERFDLFHPDHPFLQTAGMEGKEHSVAYLLPTVPTGTNPTHFHHTAEEGFGVSAGVAAKLLVSVGQFATQGGKSEGRDRGKPPSINGAPPWYVLVNGHSLFETLCLNCCVMHVPQATGSTPPAWRDDGPVPLVKTRRASLLEALTWRPRRVLFTLPTPGRCSLTGVETDSAVRTMRFRSGAAWDFAATWTDPNAAYRIDGSTRRPIRPDGGKDVWRDTGPLALLREADYESEDRRVRFERPTVVTQFAAVIGGGLLPEPTELRIQVYGLRTRQDKSLEWQHETLSIPAPLTWRSAFRTEAQRAVDAASRVSQHLAVAVKLTCPWRGKDAASAEARVKAAQDAASRKGRKRSHRLLDSRIAESQRRFWSDLRPDYDLFLRRLAELPEDDYDDALAACISAWNERLRKAGRQALDDAIGDLDTDADALVRMVNARDYFARQLHFALLSPEERAARAPNRPRGRKAAAAKPTKGGEMQ